MSQFVLFLLEKGERVYYFPLNKKVTSIGHSPENDVFLSDPSILKNHAIISEERPGQFLLQGVQSTHAVSVNNEPVKSRLLKPGDRVRLGNRDFVFEIVETQIPALPLSSEKLVEQIDQQLQFLIRQSLPQIPLSPQNTAYLAESLKKIGVDAGRLKDESRKLTILYETVNQLIDQPGLNQVLNKILSLALNYCRMQRGAILLYNDEERLDSIADLNFDDSQHLLLDHVSQSLIQKSVDHKQILVVGDTQLEEALARQESILKLNIHSIICLPLLDQQKEVIGVLYLDSQQPWGPLAEWDTEMLKTFAVHAAMAIDNHQLLELQKKTAVTLTRLKEKERYENEIEQLAKTNERLLSRLAPDGLGEVLGQSAAMQSVLAMVKKAAPSGLPVLILGETGTGKGVLAQEIHRLSPLSKGPFQTINCASLPKDLLESELFGYEKGAFTGATKRKIGKIELAHQGSLFLDEIGEIPLSLQVKLLQFLQDKIIERLGGNEKIKVDTRILAATNRDIKQAIAQGQFREDLYYRLSVVVVTIPPLRERGEDILLLARHFIQHYAGKMGKTLQGLSPAAQALLAGYAWPGNVRELENRIQRAMIMASSSTIEAHDLQLDPVEQKSGDSEKNIFNLSYPEAQEKLEKHFIKKELKNNKGHLSKTAEALGIYRNTLREMMKKYEIEKGEFKDQGED